MGTTRDKSATKLLSIKGPNSHILELSNEVLYDSVPQDSVELIAIKIGTFRFPIQKHNFIGLSSLTVYNYQAIRHGSTFTLTTPRG